MPGVVGMNCAAKRAKAGMASGGHTAPERKSMGRAQGRMATKTISGVLSRRPKKQPSEPAAQNRGKRKNSSRPKLWGRGTSYHMGSSQK